MYANDYAKFRLTDKQNILRPCVLLTQRPPKCFPHNWKLRNVCSTCTLAPHFSGFECLK